MKISNTQQALSKYLNNPEVLTNPHNYLGPNYQAVLRWWLYYESLTYEQTDELIRRYFELDHVMRERALEDANEAVIDLIGFNNWVAVQYFAPFPQILTYELIANLDDPFFLPLVVPEFNYKQN